MNFEKLHSNFLNKADGFQIEKNMSNDKFVETMSQKKKKKKRKKKESLENANKSIFLPSVIGSNGNNIFCLTIVFCVMSNGKVVFDT